MHNSGPSREVRYPPRFGLLCLLILIFCFGVCGCADTGFTLHRGLLAPRLPIKHRRVAASLVDESATRAGSDDIQLVAAWTDEQETLDPNQPKSRPRDSFANESDRKERGDLKTSPELDLGGTAKGEELPLPKKATETEEGTKPSEVLSLDQVLMSIAESFPPLEVAIAELAAAEGKALSKWGGFDTKLHAHSISAPMGFYQTYRNGFGANQPLWNGGEVYGGYRMGRGNFQPWFGERETNDGGEFKTGIKQPLLQNFAIDQRRAELEIAQLERLRLEPDIEARILEIQRMASQMYWEWVAAGRIVEVNQRLLELAEDRAENIKIRVDEDDLPRLALIDNGRMIAKRKTTLIKAKRIVEKVAIKLSLFYRDEFGTPIVAANQQLPTAFPEATRIDPAAVEADIANAIAARPEIRDLEFQRQQVHVELCRAENEMLPTVDLFAEAGQDVGGPSSPKRDKSQFELELGVLAEVPLQRRKAVGRVQAAEAKLGQIAAKRVFAEDKIGTQVQNAVSALHRAYESIERANENFELSQESVRLGRLSFDEGDIDIIELNIREGALAEAALLLIDGQFAYFAALADYRATLGFVDLP